MLLSKLKRLRNTAKAEFKAFQMQILNSKTLNLSILNTPNIFKLQRNSKFKQQGA